MGAKLICCRLRGTVRCGPMISAKSELLLEAPGCVTGLGEADINCRGSNTSMTA